MAEFKPQIGPQTAFLESPADIAIFGGAAGGGKSHAILLEAMRHTRVRGFGAVVFRRTLADVKKQGSLWDSSIPLYGSLGAVPRLDTLSWTFPNRTKITFSHLEHEKNVLDWQGAQIPLIIFDELTHFSRAQFFYMLSRNRSTCGIRPYVRATTNPDADSWVAEFIAWWIDQDTGFAIQERSGVLRWFARIGDALRWADTKEDLEVACPGCEPNSVTFIGSKLEDNKILVDADPGYRAKLMALDRVERERLLNGNWKIRPAAGLYFQRHWCEMVEAVPLGTKLVRGWDLAATPKTEMNDPDWTTGTKIGRCPDGSYIVADHIYFQGAPAQVESTILKVAVSDGREVRIHIPQDPAAAGKAQVEVYRRLLVGFNVRFAVASGDKVTRFSGFSAQADPGPSASTGGKGKIKVLRASWNERWFSQLEGFPPTGAGHDDDADSTSEAFNGLVGKFGPGEALLEMAKNSATKVAAAAPVLKTYAPGSVEYALIMAAEAAEAAKAVLAA